MTKQPRHKSLISYWWERIKQNPISVWGSLVIAIGGTATLYGQWDNVEGMWNHIRWMTPVMAQSYIRIAPSRVDPTKPFMLVQSDHDFAINYLILKDMRQALKEAKEDQKANPNSTTIPQTVDKLQKAVERQQDKLSKTPLVGK